MDESITIAIQFGMDRIFHISGRRLRPDEDAKLDDIMATVIPPVVRGDKPENDRLNYNHPDYVKAKAAIDLEARALGLYWCIPVFGKEKPGLTERKEITPFIQAKFTNQILDVLWQGIRDGGVKKAALINFTSPNTSQGN